MRCDQQVCLTCGDVGHFLDFAATGLCRACSPVVIVASIEVLAYPPALVDFHAVEALEVTEVMPAPSGWLERVA